LYDERLEQVKLILVGDIMTAEVVTITPDTHLMVIADIMIKKHIRRLPVVNVQEIVGIVYVSDVFHHLLEKFIPSGAASTP
jgi:CBS domain-containing protein